MRQAPSAVDRLVRSLRPLAEHESLELLVAWARAGLALVLLVASQLAPIDPAEHIALVNGLLLAYAIYSGSVLALLWLRGALPARAALILHGLDLLWAVLLTLWTEGTDSHLFLLFVFAVLAAAYRWGLSETMLTAFAATVLLAVETSSVARDYTHASFHLNYFLIRTSQLVLFGLVLGLLSDREKTLRSRAATISRIMRHVRVEAGPAASMQRVLDELRSLFGSEWALLAVEEPRSGGLFLWEASSRERDRRTPFRQIELSPAKRGLYFFDVPDRADVWVARWKPPEGNAGAPALLVLDPGGHRIEMEVPIPDEFVARHPCHSLACVSTIPGAERVGRLFLLNPPAKRDEQAALTLLQEIARQVGPALENVFLATRLRSRIEELERARIARELHDGVMQSLIGLEMQLEAARHDAERDSAPLAEALGHIQGLLRREVLNLRDLMQRLRPVRIDQSTFTGFVAATVNQFRHNTGIDASFVSEVDEVDLSPRACRELARVVEEALVNVRKHSGARRVSVRLGRRNGELRLTIRDDGRGFGFTGRCTLDEFDGDRRCPRVITERVLSIGGTLAIDSDPKTGAQLDIAVPVSRYE